MNRIRHLMMMATMVIILGSNNFNQYSACSGSLCVVAQPDTAACSGSNCPIGATLDSACSGNAC
jgi:hypothetical protein